MIEFRRTLELESRDRGLAIASAFFRLLVEKLRLRRRPAKFDDGFDDHGPFIRAVADVERVAGTHGSARFGAGAIDLYFAAGHGFGGERSCLKKARRPEPLIDASLFVTVVAVHRSSLDYPHMTAIEARALRSKQENPQSNVQSSRLKVGIELKR